jgi:tRNA (mo5U34)-methyltransferase
MTSRPKPPALTRAEAERRIATVPYWFHRIELQPGLVTPGASDVAATLALLPLPEDARGLRVLDVGASDGFFSFELDRRGAEVLALDHVPPAYTGFAVSRELLGSRVEHVVGNVYDLAPERHGEFDLVLFLGVLYHLRHPLLGLDALFRVCRGTLVLETQVLDEAFLAGDATLRRLTDLDPALSSAAIAQFYPEGALLGDRTNAWVPNAAALAAMLESACFEITHGPLLTQQRAIVAARRAPSALAAYFRDRDRAADVAAIPMPPL